MPFAPEDTKVWESSEVMAEFEKIATDQNLLGGGPPEAFQPIPEKEAGEPAPSWEEESAPAELIQERAPLPPVEQTFAMKAFASQQETLLEAVKDVARGLADKGNIKGAYRAERAAAELEAIIRRTPAEGGE